MNALITALWQRNKVGVIAAAGQSQSQDCRAQDRCAQDNHAQDYRAQNGRAQDCRAQDCRAQAHECQQVANRWPDDLVKQQYEELARQWRVLAEHAEGRR
jgi:hypothetical protein